MIRPGTSSRLEKVQKERSGAPSGQPPADSSHERPVLTAEVRYRRERLDLYRARIYSGRPTSPQRLRALQHEYDGAVSRLRHSESSAGDPARP